MYQKFGISEKLEKLSKEVEKELTDEYQKVDNICEINSLKVLNAMQECNLQEMHLNSSTGYGIDEPGRNKIEEIYAKVFKAEDSLVRAQFISGTHALAITLSALLRPGETMISLTGAPYDTLQTVIGCNNEESKSSLKAYGIKYEQIELINNDDKERKAMSIIVYDNYAQSKIIDKKNIIKSNQVICPKCQESARIKFENLQIKIYDCKNGHISYLLLNEFDDSQIIDESKVFCNVCREKNKSNTYNRIMYICNSCKIFLCPLCHQNHDKSHNIINQFN